jgi:hypothetical protein
VIPVFDASCADYLVGWCGCGRYDGNGQRTCGSVEYVCGEGGGGAGAQFLPPLGSARAWETQEGNPRLGDYTNNLDYYNLTPPLKCNVNAMSLRLESWHYVLDLKNKNDISKIEDVIEARNSWTMLI